MTELEDIILTIDTREQNQMRIKAVEDWFTGHNAIVEHLALQHCDYRLIGEFRGQSVNLGVEAKGWDNFLSDDISEMEEKLLLATAEYDHVGFFVETQNYSFVPDENNKHSKLNYSIPRLNKNLPAKTLAAFEGLLHTISKHPQIYVTQLRSEAQFPYSLYDLLVYLQKPHILTVKPEGYVPSLQNLYMQIPQVGIERAKKLIQHYPNLFWLCSASEPSLIAVMGQSMGTILYQFLHNTELQTPEWMAGHHLDGTVKYKTICGQDCYNPQHCNTLCERHPNNPKNVKQDDEGRLAFDAPAKNPVKTPLTNAQDIAIQEEEYASGARLEEQPACNTPTWKARTEAGNGKVAGSTPASDLKCNYADPKNRAECKTPDHFKQHSKIPSHAEGTPILELHHNPPIPSADIIPSHPGKDISTSVKHGNTPHPPLSGDTSQSSSTETLKQGESPGTRDTSSHPSSFIKSLPTSQKLDDPQRPPINRNQNSGVKQESLCVLSSPAEINIGLDDTPSEYVIRCRACYQPIKPKNDDDTGFCHDQDCIKIRNEPSLENKLRIFLREPHTVEEIVEKYGCSTGYTYQVCMANVKSGNIKKMTEQDGRTTFQRIT